MTVVEPPADANLNRTVRDITDRLTLRTPPGWTTIGTHLLNSVDRGVSEDDQRGVLAASRAPHKVGLPGWWKVGTGS